MKLVIFLLFIALAFAEVAEVPETGETLELDPRIAEHVTHMIAEQEMTKKSTETVSETKDELAKSLVSMYMWVQKNHAEVAKATSDDAAENPARFSEFISAQNEVKDTLCSYFGHLDDIATSVLERMPTKMTPEEALMLDTLISRANDFCNPTMLL